jgi:hypothetical protein
VNFCDHKGLNMPTMRVTWEAKNQLKDLLVSSGFPESCFVPQEYNFTGPDPKLDMVIALLAMGKYFFCLSVGLCGTKVFCCLLKCGGYLLSVKD